jgi:hypothetical protein
MQIDRPDLDSRSLNLSLSRHLLDSYLGYLMIRTLGSTPGEIPNFLEVFRIWSISPLQTPILTATLTATRVTNYLNSHELS